MLPAGIKKSFRTAYDFLEKWYPPKDETEYFSDAAKDMAGRMDGQDALTENLLMAVYDYLEVKAKSDAGRKA